MEYSTKSADAASMHADKLMAWTVALIFLICVALGFLTNSWQEVLWVGLPAAGAPLIIIYLSPGALVSRLAVALSFMIFCALMIQQTGGAIEAHFGIFVLLAFLLFYRDWRPILLAATVIAIHHLTFNYMQQDGLGVHLFSQGASLERVVVHALYVIFEAGLLIYISIILRAEANMLGGEPKYVTQVVGHLNP